MYYLDSHLSNTSTNEKKKTILTLPPRPVSAESSFLSGGRLSRLSDNPLIADASEVFVSLHFIVIE